MDEIPMLHIIAAACKNRGIGFQGKLPWRLKNEMAYFTMMTTTTTDKDKQNAVIMGRKSWFSIPKKFRPLPGRLNVVLSREVKELPEADVLAHSLDEAVKLLKKPPLSDKVEDIFVIGGEEIYKLALDSTYRQKVYLTRIDKDFECDTFFPPLPEYKYKLTVDPHVPQEEQEENGIKYKFEVYELRIAK